MEYLQEDYTKYYIVQALFKLMGEYEYEKINVTDIAKKAGVGRATFYRYFKRKEDVLVYYMDRNRQNFIFSQRYYPRCREDYLALVKNVFELFRENKEPIKLMRRARLEYIYLDFLNKNFADMFCEEYPEQNGYAPYLYAGMLFNVSMAWLDGDCAGSADDLAEVVVNAIYN